MWSTETATFFRATSALAVARVSTMAISLCAVTLTYHALNSRDFGLFNLLLLLMTVGSAISLPFNRAFWASNSGALLWLSSGASVLMTIAIVVPGVAIAMLMRAYPYSVLMFGALSAGLYATARVFERYAYGRLLISGHAAGSVQPILAFALIDVFAVSIMWVSGSTDLVLRLLVPATGFLAVAGLLSLHPTRPAWIARVPPMAQLLRFIRVHLASPVGVRVILSGTLLTMAGMVDRAIFYLFPPASEAFGAAYLLALAYAIAFQTLLSLLFDLARTHVYRNGAWETGARRFAKRIVAAAVALAAGMAASYPIIVYVGLLPLQVDWLLWTALLARALALSASNILNVDHFQEGRLKQVMMAGVAVFAGALGGLMVLYLGGSTTLTAFLMLAVSLLVIVVLSLQFFARVPRI